MTPHKHADIIKAWADGAEIEYRTHAIIEWKQVFKGWSWDNALAVEYRIKPQPKPDVVRWCWGTTYLGHENPFPEFGNGEKPNLKLTFDGETGKLKSAELL